MKILIIGATGHIGSAVAEALRQGHEVVEASRAGEHRVDITDAASIERLFAEVGTVDAVICSVGSVPWAPATTLGPDDYRAAFENKTLAQIDVVRAALARLADGGSITLTTGITARRAVPGGAAASMANGALESFVIGAAPELPRGIRLNVASPTVLAEATEYHETFADFPPVPAAVVAAAYVELVEGDRTGAVVAID